jgi:hypothetical protein
MILGTSRAVRVYAYPEPVDLRRATTGCSGSCERGRFASPWRTDGSVVRMTASELALFIEGCELVGRRALSPAAVVPSPLGA